MQLLGAHKSQQLGKVSAITFFLFFTFCALTHVEKETHTKAVNTVATFILQPRGARGYSVQEVGLGSRLGKNLTKLRASGSSNGPSQKCQYSRCFPGTNMKYGGNGRD